MLPEVLFRRQAARREVPGLKEMVPPEPPTAEEEKAARLKAAEAPSASSGDL